jgi:hypothetical protein
MNEISDLKPNQILVSKEDGSAQYRILTVYPDGSVLVHRSFTEEEPIIIEGNIQMYFNVT